MSVAFARRVRIAALAGVAAASFNIVGPSPALASPTGLVLASPTGLVAAKHPARASVTSVTGPTARPAVAEPLLGWGSTGPAVRDWQIELDRFFGLPRPDHVAIAADGIFGPITQGATESFQRYSGITVDGLVGPISRAAAARLDAGVVPNYVPGPACDGASCVGQSPYITNRQGVSCVDDAQDVPNAQVSGFGGAVVRLRYSPSCQANWVALDQGSDPTYVVYYVETTDGTREYGSSQHPFFTGYFSTMVDGTQLARVCLSELGIADPRLRCDPRWH